MLAKIELLNFMNRLLYLSFLIFILSYSTKKYQIYITRLITRTYLIYTFKTETYK